ncbi:MAG TPA: Holliday junction branch migration protein RuvA [Actinomycetota bacterium]|nr:Holliday junction branch migration protein RuvA [Actinomycetota bacterium]
MIGSLRGEVVEKAGTRILLDVGGVGYEVLVPTSTAAALPPVGRTARLLTRLQVREDGMALFGFATAEERAVFDLLVGVNGVGPRLALAFLSALRPDAFRRAVAAGDAAALTVVPGVGRKLAQRVVLDLRDRLGGEPGAVEGPLAEVREALLALGLSPQEATEAMAGLPADGDGSVEDLLRRALQRVGRRPSG